MSYRGSQAALRAGNDADDLRVLRELARGDAMGTPLRHALAAYVNAEAVGRALDRLVIAGHVVKLATLPRPTWRITDAGRLAAVPKPRAMLPVLSNVTPGTAVDCGRRNVVLTATQCATNWRVRDDGPCALDRNDNPSRCGCPVGAQVRAVLHVDERAA